MQPFLFVEGRGWAWHVYDYVVVGHGAGARKRSLSVGDRHAEGRAFVPLRRHGPVMVYSLVHGSWHGTERRTLESQLYYSKPFNAAGEGVNEH